MYSCIFLTVMLFPCLPVGGDISLVNREQAQTREEEKLKHFPEKTAGVLSEMKHLMCFVII